MASSSLRRALAVSVAATVFVVVLTGIVITLNSHAGDAGTSGAQRTALDRVPDGVRARFSVFAPRAAEKLDGGTVSALGRAAESLGVDISLARTAVATDGRKAIIVPGQDRMCL